MIHNLKSRGSKTLSVLLAAALMLTMLPGGVLKAKAAAASGALTGGWATIAVTSSNNCYLPAGIAMYEGPAIDNNNGHQIGCGYKNVFVADSPGSTYNIIRKWDGSSWSVIAGPSSGFGHSLVGIAVNRGEDLFVACAGALTSQAVWKYDSSGATWTDITAGHQFQGVRGIAVLGDYALVLNMKGGTPEIAVYGLSTAGVWTEGAVNTSGISNFNPVAIAVPYNGDAETAYLLDSSGKIYECSASGDLSSPTFTCTLVATAPDGSGYSGLTVLPEGTQSNGYDFYVTNSSNQCVEAILRSGSGSPSSWEKMQYGASNQFSSPAGIAVNCDGNMYMADSYLINGSQCDSKIASHSSIPAQLVWSTQPGGGITGKSLSQQPVLTLKDNYNKTKTDDSEDQVTVSIASGSGTLNGTATVTLKSGVATFSDLGITGPGTYTLTANCGGITSTSASFTIANVASGAQSMVTASPASVTADGSSTSAITVTLEDSGGNLLSGKTVALSQNSGGHSTITTVSGTSNASGQATFTVKNTKAETVTYTAVDQTDGVTIGQTAQVQFVAGATAKLVLTATTLTGTEGTHATIGPITATAEDQNGNATNVNSDTVVNLSSNTAGTAVFSKTSGGQAVTSVTIPAGKSSAVFYYGDTSAGSPTITASAQNLTPASANVTVLSAPVLSVTAASGGSSYTSGAWTANSVLFSLSDTVQNPDGITYQVSTDGGINWTNLTGSSYSVSSDGSQNFRFRIQSVAGSTSNVVTYTVNIDTQNPTGEITIHQNSWTAFLNTITFNLFFRDTQTATITGNDTGSGVQSVRYQLVHSQSDYSETGAWADYPSGGVSLNPDEKYIVYAKITDQAGNYTIISSDGVVVDATSPTLTLTSPASGWQPGNVTVNVAASDALSGIDAVSYTTDESTPQSGTVSLTNGSGTVTLTDNGNYTLTVTAQDKAGNTYLQTKQIQIDKTAPLDVSIRFSKDPVKTILNFITFHDFFKDSVDVIVSANDSGSGVGRYEYQKVNAGDTFDANGTWTDGTSLTIFPNWKGTVYARAVDQAGNVSGYISKSLVVNNAAPTIAANNGSTALTTTDKNAAIPVTVSSGDAGLSSVTWQIGLAGYSMQTRGGYISGTDPVQSDSFGISDLPDGRYDVTVNATDNAGNTAQTAIIHVNKNTAPSVTGVSVTPGSVTLSHGEKQRFTADVAGTNLTLSTSGVTWSVSGSKSSNTSIDANGNLTVASDESAVSLTVTATSSNNSTVSGKATVAVNTSDQIGFGFSDSSIDKVCSDAPFAVSASGGQGDGAVTYKVTGGSGAVSLSGNTVTPLKAGTAVITATKAAYGSFNQATATLTIRVGKGTPAITAAPTASTVLVTGLLSDVSLFGGKASVDGTFAWTNPDAKVSMSGNYSVTFTPNDTDDYNTVTCTVPLTVGTVVGNSGSGITVDLSGVTLPDGVTSVTLGSTPQESADGAQYSVVVKLISSDSSLGTLRHLVVYDLKLLDQNGNPIESFSGKVKVKIPVPAGMSGNLHVFWYDDGAGRLTDMNAVQKDGYLIFETTHFSYYAVAVFKAQSSGTDSNTGNPNTGDNIPIHGFWPLLALPAAFGTAFVIKKRRFRVKRES